MTAKFLASFFAVLSVGLGMVIYEITVERDAEHAKTVGMVSQFDYQVMQGKFVMCRDQYLNVNRPGVRDETQNHL